MDEQQQLLQVVLEDAPEGFLQTSSAVSKVADEEIGANVSIVLLDKKWY